jgi:hypothetical protein
MRQPDLEPDENNGLFELSKLGRLLALLGAKQNPMELK